MEKQLSNSRSFYFQLVMFFIPIAAMSILMKSSQSIISAALARTITPAIAITAFSVSNSIATMIQAPCWAILKVSVATANDQKSYRSLMIVGWWTFGIVMALMLMVGFVPPITKLVFVKFSGLSAEILPDILRAYRIFLFMPIMGVFRTLASGFVTLQKKTVKLTIAVIFRIAYMLVIMQLLLKGKWLVGGAIGAFLFVSGFWVESLITLWSSKGFKSSLPEQPTTGTGLSVKQIWFFFLPLIVAQFINSFISPAINSGLARINDPEIAIASFFVAYSFSRMILSIGFRLHQVVVVYAKDTFSWLRVKRFIIAFSIITTVLLLFIAISPLGSWIFVGLIGLDSAVLSPVLKTLAVIAFAPIFLFLAEAYEGVLLQHKKTYAITLAKVSNIIGLIVALVVFSNLFPNAGATLGGICIVASYIVEAGVAIILARPVMSSLLIKSENVAV